MEDEKERKRLKTVAQPRFCTTGPRKEEGIYVSTLEDERRAMEAKTSELEAEINTLERENFHAQAGGEKSTKAGTEKMGLALLRTNPRVVPSQ